MAKEELSRHSQTRLIHRVAPCKSSENLGSPLLRPPPWPLRSIVERHWHASAVARLSWLGEMQGEDAAAQRAPSFQRLRVRDGGEECELGLAGDNQDTWRCCCCCCCQTPHHTVYPPHLRDRVEALYNHVREAPGLKGSRTRPCVRLGGEEGLSDLDPSWRQVSVQRLARVERAHGQGSALAAPQPCTLSIAGNRESTSRRMGASADTGQYIKRLETCTSNGEEGGARLTKRSRKASRPGEYVLHAAASWLLSVERAPLTRGGIP